MFLFSLWLVSSCKYFPFNKIPTAGASLVVIGSKKVVGEEAGAEKETGTLEADNWLFKLRPYLNVSSALILQLSCPLHAFLCDD